MDKKKKWRFPGNGGTKKNGLDTTDFHTFMDDPAASLAREICQNSNDARTPGSKKPAVVEFHAFSVKTSSIPGVDELIEELTRCEDYWHSQNEEMAQRIADIKALYQAERIDVLRISDFNTIGLDGVEEPENESSSWYSLLHGSGESGKKQGDGGSKGVGKYATFVNSLVRTVFYSTYSQKGQRGFQGIAYFCSSKVKDSPVGELTQGIGYYGLNQRNDAICEEFQLDPKFSRKNGEFGTDIYVIGFDAKNGWESDIVSKVLDSFMAAIHRGRLKVIVAGREISGETLKNIVFDEALIRSDMRRSVVSQYVLLSGDESVIHKTVKVESGGRLISEVELFIKRFVGEEQKYATHACSMVRHPLMKIKDLKKIVNPSMGCSALCVIPEGQLASLFKLSENPEHTDWIWPRIKDTAKRGLAQKLYSDLSDQIQTIILDALKTPDTDETDAAGASKYLPEHEPGKEKPAEKGGREVPKPIVTKPKKKRTSEINTYYEDPNGNGVGMDIVDTDVPGETDTLNPSGSNQSDGGDIRPGDEKREGKTDKNGDEAFVRQNMKGITYHFFCKNKAKGEYALSFFSPRTIESAECTICMVDESSSGTPIDILSATVNGAEAEVRDGRKILFPLHEGERVKLVITTNIRELFSAEVRLYAVR